MRQEIKNGVDFIKTTCTGGDSTGTLPHASTIPPDELNCIVETAHRLGKKVAAHARGTDGIRDAINAGVDSIEHSCFEGSDGVFRMVPEQISRIAKQGIYVVPTIRLYQNWLNQAQRDKDTGNKTPNNLSIELLKTQVAEKLNTLAAFNKAGAKIVAGNDACLVGTGFGEFWQELEIMTRGGMTPMEAILSATITAAEMLGNKEKIGSITVGKYADLIAVADYPTRKIDSLSKVIFVMKGGRVYKNLKAPQQCEPLFI